MEKEFDYLVVGSGVTGMTISLLLADCGFRVLLLEKSSVIGGSMQRFCRNGIPFDTGFHFTAALTGCTPIVRIGSCDPERIMQILDAGAMGLITGESIGQVASQTLQSLAATNDVCTMPVFRPVIGFDKQEIIDLSEKIGTYETSIQPYEDCCTIFVAKHPVTRPNINVIRGSEKRLGEKMEELVREALNTTERILCQGR